MIFYIIDTVNNIPSHRQFQDLASALVSTGHEVIHFSDSERPNYAGVKVVHYDKKRRWQSFSLFIKYCRKTEPEVVVSTFSGNKYADLLSWLFPFRWYAFIQSDFYHRRFYNRLRLRRVSKFFALSSPMISKTENMFPHLKGRVAVMPNSFDFSDVLPCDKKNIILHVGTATLNAAGKLVKGTDVLIDAYQQLPGSIRNVTELWIAGDGPALITIQNQAEGIAGIHFTGRLSHDQVMDYMKQSKLFVLPSRNEAFGQVFLEAMQYGCSLIGTEGTGAVDIVESGPFGRIVPQEDASALAHAIVELLESYQFEKAVQAYAQKREQFSRRNWVQAMMRHIT